MNINKMNSNWYERLNASFPFCLRENVFALKHCKDFKSLILHIYQRPEYEIGFYYQDICFYKVWTHGDLYRIIIPNRPYVDIDFNPYIENCLVEEVLLIITSHTVTPKPIEIVTPSNYRLNVDKVRKSFYEKVFIKPDFIDYRVNKNCQYQAQLKHRLFRDSWHCGDTFYFRNLAFMNVRADLPLWYIIKDGHPIGSFDFDSFKEFGKHDELFYLLMSKYLNVD